MTDSAYTQLTADLEDLICTTCNGEGALHTRKTCPRCHGSGMISPPHTFSRGPIIEIINDLLDSPNPQDKGAMMITYSRLCQLLAANRANALNWGWTSALHKLSMGLPLDGDFPTLRTEMEKDLDPTV